MGIKKPEKEHASNEERLQHINDLENRLHDSEQGRNRKERWHNERFNYILIILIVLVLLLIVIQQILIS